MLYLRNIFTEGKSNEELSSCVIQHAQTQGIRVMTADIINNRYVQDIVGCKIRVPLPQADRALEFGVWPEDITCRRWSKEKPVWKPQRERNWDLPDQDADTDGV